MTPILTTLGFGKYNGLGGKVEPGRMSSLA